MSTLKPGSRAPAFTLPADGGGKISLKDFKGKKLVLYFYPKDDTPGCTTEACDFRDNMSSLKRQGVAVLGISKDGVARHDKFKAKYELNFPLAADEDGAVCEKYGVWVEKKNYGKTYMGIERATFLIDENGVVRQIWRKVKVKGHVDDIKTALRDLRKAA